MASIQDSSYIDGPPLRSALASSRGSGSNIFIAARPDAAAAASAHTLAREICDSYRIGGQPLSMSRLHVSLIDLGIHDVLPDRLVRHVREALDELTFEPFEIVFDRISGFRSKVSYPVVLCADRQDDRLRIMVEHLADRLSRLGIARNRKPDLIAHMILIYHTSAVMQEQLATPIRWTVDRIWLIDSLLGHGTHTVLWPSQCGQKAA